LCELYPRTALRLKWLAVERHKELEAIKLRKEKIQTVLPTLWNEKLDPHELKSQIPRMDKQFADYRKKHGRDYDFGVKGEDEEEND
jgi:hypothetical protein